MRNGRYPMDGCADAARLGVTHMAANKRSTHRSAKQAATPAKSRKKPAARRAKKAVAASKKAAAKRPATRTRADKATAAAAPLLASAPKKTGKVTARSSEAVKPNAPYQPKSKPAPLAKAPRAAATPVFDPLALVRPWMRFGLQMTMSNLAVQFRLVRAAMDSPPAAAAMRQGSTAYKAWLATFDRVLPVKG